MAFTETRTTGYGSRLGNSCMAIPMGIILFLVATALLWWNEGRAVHRAQDIKQVAKTAQSIGDISNANTSLDGQLIHTTGTASTEDILSDDLFGIKTNALAIVRSAEYYQWKENEKHETKDKLGGKQEEIITYTYERDWTADPINSSRFKDPDYQNVNNVIWEIEDMRVIASNVSFGTYILPELFISDIVSKQSDNVSPLMISADNPALKQLNENVMKALGDNVRPEAAQVKDSLAYVHVFGNQVYIGFNPSNPSIGDIRLTFEQLAPSCNISLIAVPTNGTFTTFQAKHDANEYELRVGTWTLDQMIKQANDENATLTWILRILGVIVVIAALKMIFGILVTILKLVPFLASIMNLGVSLVCGVLGFVWSLIVIAIAWIFYRPLLGIALLVIAAGLVYWLVIKGKKQQAVE
ncbi:MAG: TMEM43 family protein [Bacteroidales bacterium]|nr:TMEM43 family protein [Bacteroidales bacterium]